MVAGRRLWLAARKDDVPLSDQAHELHNAWQPSGRNAGRVVLKLDGTDSISAAEALAGKFLLLPTSALPPLDPGSFRVRDLIGCALYDRDRCAGTVIDVQFPVAADGRTRLEDAPDLLVVELPGIVASLGIVESPVASKSQAATAASAGPASDVLAAATPLEKETEPVLVPFVQAWLLAVDIAAKRILMQLPPGLFPSTDAEEVTPTAAEDDPRDQG